MHIAIARYIALAKARHEDRFVCLLHGQAYWHIEMIFCRNGTLRCGGVTNKLWHGRAQATWKKGEQIIQMLLIRRAGEIQEKDSNLPEGSCNQQGLHLQWLQQLHAPLRCLCLCLGWSTVPECGSASSRLLVSLDKRVTQQVWLLPVFHTPF